MFRRISSFLATLLVLLAVSAPTWADARVTTEKVTVHHNVYRNNVKGMVMLVDFTAYGLIGTNCRSVAYFNFADGRKLIGPSTGKFRARDGQVCTTADFVPDQGRSQYARHELFLPYSCFSFLPSGKTPLKFHIVYSVKADGSNLGSTGYTNLNYSK